MKLTKVGLLASVIFSSAVAMAGTITPSENVSVVVFDGQKVKKSTKLETQQNTQHQLVVEVSSLYHSGSDSVFFESQPIILSFNGSQENLRLSLPALKSSLAVEQFKKQPQFNLRTESGKEVAYQWDYLKGEGFMPNANLIQNLAEYNAGNGVAAVKSLNTATPATALPVSTKATKDKVVVQGENIAEQQLQYWYQQADKETKQRFLKWATRQ